MTRVLPRELPNTFQRYLTDLIVCGLGLTEFIQVPRTTTEAYDFENSVVHLPLIHIHNVDVLLEKTTPLGILSHMNLTRSRSIPST